MSVSFNLRRPCAYVLAAGLAFAAALGTANAAENHAAAVAKVRSLLSQMTREEKMALIRGETEPEATNQGEAGYLAGVPRLGIPPLRLADGPPGILTRIPAAALTATMGLAATFSRVDARANGVVIGNQANERGVDVALQPFVNIDRDITFRRGYNTFGEDPVLSGAIAAEMIKGIQSRGVMAMVKHYVAFDSSANDITEDAQSLHEIDLAPFDDAVKAGVASIMCAYNRINGPYACGNRELLDRVLRGEMGFKGFVTSDWGAVHDYDFLAKGLDMEMPGRFNFFFLPSFFDTEEPRPVAPPDFSNIAFTEFIAGRMPEEPQTKFLPAPADRTPVQIRNMWSAINEGVVTQAMIDQAAARVLMQIVRFGYLDGSRAARIKTPSGLNAGDVIRKTGDDAAVLLKNDGGVLPLSPEKSGSIAMIGPGAAQVVVAIGKSGERSIGLPARQVGPFDALKQAMPGADLRLAVANDMTGHPLPAKALSQNATTPGLAHNFGDRVVGNDAAIDFTGANALPAGTNNIWDGTLSVPTDGCYVLAIQSLGTRGMLSIDGQMVAATSGLKGGLHGDVVQAGQDGLFPTPDGLNNARGAIQLTAGAHTLHLAANADNSGLPVQIRLNWVTPEEQAVTRAAAVEAARSARTAVVFVWSRGVPTFALPGEQDRLVEDVVAANPNTIVVLNVSQPVAMPWIDKVKGVVQMWWPGDEGGWSTADVLTGRTNPGGRLPFTWAKRLEDYADTARDHPERNGSSPDQRANYSEGVDVGYRWFDAQGETPLFPFGYGLSYTAFRYSGLHVTKARNGGVDAHFELTNSGSVDGEEVAQLYVSAPKRRITGVQFAPEALAGFDRIFLTKGESKTVTLHIDRRGLQYWSVATRKWVDAPSTRTLSVGASSRDLRLKVGL